MTEKNISDLRAQLEELEQLNYTVSLQIPSKKTVSGQDRGDEDEEDFDYDDAHYEDEYFDVDDQDDARCLQTGLM